MKYFVKRSLAYLIDCSISFGVVMLLFQWLILSNIRSYIGIDDGWFHNSWNMWLYVILSISLPVYLYFAYFDSAYSKSTFGKRWMKLEILDNGGERISFRLSLLRTIAKLLPWEIIHLGLIFPTPIYFSNKANISMLTYFGIGLFVFVSCSLLLSASQQTIYDKWLKTRVVEV